MTTRVPFSVETKRALIEGTVFVLAYPGSPASYDHPGDPPEFEIDDVEIDFVEFRNYDFFGGPEANQEWVKRFVLSRLDEDRLFEDAAEILADSCLPD